MAERKPRVKWNQHAIDDDIKYRGPLSYRHFKIIGWLLFVLKMLIPPLKLAVKAAPAAAEVLATPLSIMELIAPLSVFFLLIASMSQLLVKGNYKKQMLVNGGAALAIIVFFELIYHHYIVGYVDAFIESRPETLSICNAVFSSLNPMGFITFNVFLDLFLCTCVMFFLNYEPTKVFVGEKRKWFRLFALLPVIYELVCLWLKLLANSGEFHMPISTFPFLTTKPPMMFFVFCAMVIYQMLGERRFCKGGRTHEEYVQYLGTNRNSWQFAKFAAIACFIAGLADLVIALVAISGEMGASMDYLKTLTDEAKELVVYNMINKYLNAGFGGSADLLFFAPIMLLFNYTKTYKNTLVEMAIPIVAIVLLIFIYLEGSLFAVRALAKVAKEQVLPQIALMLEEAESEDGGGGGEDIGALLALLAAEEEAPASGSTQQPANGSSQQQEAPAQAPAQEYAVGEVVPEGAPA